MTTFGTDLHEDSQGLKTSAVYGDIGDGSNGWSHFSQVADGADVALGAQADAAVTNPATAASLVSVMKGVLTLLTDNHTAATKTEDSAHASGDRGMMVLGVRNDARATFAGTTLDYSPMATTPAGAALSALVPTDLSSWALTRSSSAAVAASLVVKSSAGRLFKLFVHNTGAAQFIQVHNTSSLPAEGVAPQHIFRVAANTDLEVDMTVFGDAYSTGITICNSTTASTKTIGAADCFISALYI